MWVYTELIYDVNPTLIIEIGNWAGGTLLYLSDIARTWSRETRFIGIDIDHSRLCDEIRGRKEVTLIESDATSAVKSVRSKIKEHDTVLVIEDSSHEYDHTLSILHLYGSLVTVGSYLICEDTICNHGLDIGPMPGPCEAVAEYLKTHPEFSPYNNSPFGVTWNQNGVLKKIS